jgi:hypothetical protein
MPQLSFRLRPPLVVGAVVASLSAAALAFVPAQATNITVTPTEAGNPPVVRESSVSVAIDQGARTYYRSSATPTILNPNANKYAAQTAATLVTANLVPALASGLVCRGDIPGGVDNSPRDTITVTGPDGATATVTPAVSPVRDFGLTSTSTSPKNKVLAPQPAPSATNYRGDTTVASGDNTYHGMTATADLAGLPAGIYTTTVKTRNMVKTGATGACQVGTPKADDPTQVDAGEATTTSTFEYRPWQHTFTDVLGKGRVAANATPKEFTFTVDGKKSTIYAGTATSQTFYAVPDAVTVPLPSQPCGPDTSACLPKAAVQCDPGPGCNPRLMLLYVPTSEADGNGIVGFFDLETKAFIATVKVDGTSRTLMSLGTVNDSAYHDALTKLSEYAAANGTDLASILATKVRVRSGDTETSLSLLNGLQVDPSTGHDGVQIVSDATVQAGVILNVYAELSSESCTGQSGDSDESTAAPDRYQRTLPTGYTVTKSDLVPEVPKAGALGAIVGGPVYHIVGKFGPGATVNTTGAVIGVDTAADEPNGYPAWIEPFLSGTRLATAKTFDFLGTATWSASESSLGALGCLSVNFMLGTGVAVLNNPLNVGLGTIFDPLATPNPAAQQLTDTVNDAVDKVVSSVTSNPTVDALLGELLAALPLA